MAKKKASRSAKPRVATRTSVATFIGVGLLTASAAAAAFGFASLSMSAARPTAVTIRANASTPSSGILLGTQTNVELARFDVTAGVDPLAIDRFSFTNCIARRDVDGDCADSGETSVNFSGMLSAMSVSYPDSTGATVVSTAAPVADTVQFQSQTFYVPSRSTRTIVVYGDIASVDDSGLFSGDRLQVYFNATTLGVPSGFRAIGATSARTYTESTVNQNVGANAMVIRATEPTFSLSSASPSGPYTASTLEVLRFNAVAASEGDIDLNRITFRFSASDTTGWSFCDALTTSDFEFYDLTSSASSPIAATYRLYDVDGNPCTSSTDRAAYVEVLMNEVLPAGSPVTYALKMNAGYAEVGDSLRVDIAGWDEMRGYSFPSLTWDDGTARGTLINERFIDGLELTGGVITF